ncbi:PACE efflux transporter [Gemmobacter lutimaris]|uniref:PACE efflux transporter n=1 Tax=Gemmobacter lutimaris TaxID=2306023 RepID=A0A398BRC8_9RHOB|nr:PACE efflux transporter [Gemmobacter lutimaris]RID92972.1 PACE efflux transporter [Gemmobacter lutimaris]
MRNFRDRLRHALSFEILGLLLVTPLAIWLLDMPAAHVGVVTAGSATLAVIWTWAYNWGFDLILHHRRGDTRKGPGLRILHAVLFELGLLVVLAPFIAWWLDVSLTEALLLDLGFALFYMVYAWAFNWGYDRLFPLPEWAEGG